MQDAGRCRASDPLKNPSCRNPAVRARSPTVARWWRPSGTTGPFTVTRERIYLALEQFWGRAVRRASQDPNLGLGRLRFVGRRARSCGCSDDVCHGIREGTCHPHCQLVNRACRFECANPKVCKSSAEAAKFWQVKMCLGLNATINAGYDGFRVQQEVR